MRASNARQKTVDGIKIHLLRYEGRSAGYKYTRGETKKQCLRKGQKHIYICKGYIKNQNHKFAAQSVSARAAKAVVQTYVIVKFCFSRSDTKHKKLKIKIYKTKKKKCFTYSREKKELLSPRGCVEVAVEGRDAKRNPIRISAHIRV